MPDTTGLFYPQAAVLSTFAFLSWILCIGPLVWHFGQGNIAAGSIILWVILNNFFNAINPLIWPHDNLDQWWNGNFWCDIHVRVQVGSIVGITMSAVMILRKLTKVMDTRNITVSSSRNSKLKEKALDIIWCWIFPLFMIIIYYIVQPARYLIYGIIGCRSAFDTSWLSVLLNLMWAPITAFVATGYACLLCYRLYRYRREFARLLSARNTTKSRFIRLFIICIVVVVVYTPWALWIFADTVVRMLGPYSWSRVHNPKTFNHILKYPSNGTVNIDKWGQVVTGYILFLLFGTGLDAYNMYQNALLRLGLGKIFPSLYIKRESRYKAPSSFIAARTWTSNMSSKAKNMLASRADSSTDSIDDSTHRSSVGPDLKPEARSATPKECLLHHGETQHHVPPAKAHFFERFFSRQGSPRSVLPLFVHRSVLEINKSEPSKSAIQVNPSSVSSHVWAARETSTGVGAASSVHVVHEVHMDCQDKVYHDTQGGRIEICGNEQFTLGRDPELCRYYWSNDLTISRQHLRVHCILYEQNPVSNIAPFVYATDVSANGTYLRKSGIEFANSQNRGIPMGRKNTFLLNNGDEISLSETVRLIFLSGKAANPFEFTDLQEREMAIFARDFLITNRLLGEGGYGKVLIGIDQTTQRQFACKMIRLDKLYEKPSGPCLRLPTSPSEQNSSNGKKRWPTRVAACFREFDILKGLSHPNIIQIQKVFWSNNTIYILQELVTGGDLFSFLEYNGGRLDNAQVTVIIRQVLIGVKYLHDQDIVHRDLKPDNILMTSLEDGARVVITDFGNARFLPDANGKCHQGTTKYQRMFSYVGTLEFAAPEIHKANRTIPAEEGYSKSVDMWSIGAITATILTGDFIFTNINHPQYRKDPRLVIVGLAANCDLSVLDDEDHPSWSKVADISKDFIKCLLVLEEDDRMTVTEALAHDWFTNKCYAQELEDLYTRSIEQWRPRPADSQLVERISKLTHDIIHTPRASQNWRTNSSKQLIASKCDLDEFDIESQMIPASYETCDAGWASQLDHSSYNHNEQQQEQQSHPGIHRVPHITEYRNEVTSQHQEDYSRHRTAHSEYSAAHESNEENYGSTPDLDDFVHIAHSQNPFDVGLRPQRVDDSPEVALVQETPIDQYETHASGLPKSDY
ncbi:pheromone A receptor-domain-containing protein [Phaeosphaeriaceae sp. PMI808]|nr:pheromone A receptor-domain-containing protein [Phaeosphaeriaceae sp. PMI808]